MASNKNNTILDFANPVAPQMHSLVILILAEWGGGLGARTQTLSERAALANIPRLLRCVLTTAVCSRDLKS